MYKKQQIPQSKKKQEIEKVKVELSKVGIKQCDCLKVTGGTTPLCMNTSVPIDAITTGVIAQIPVVLAELIVQINISAFIELPEPAYKIKEIENKIKATECLLTKDANMLFIKGILRKSIHYLVKDASGDDWISGDLRQCTVNVPFSCTTEVDFNGSRPFAVEINKSSEFCTEFYNAFPYCQLANSRIITYNEEINDQISKNMDQNSKEIEFTKLEEKMALFLTIKILQNRQVKIPYSSTIDIGGWI
ncbi:hypothetical protein [Crassaminicella indica]|uniref:SipL SPOCS domain-containing protein n=1 Tax=Crassaminicella indica TaxID=2855394 RepID=A0ABX8RDJ2_9CLOT|nr:hypothetical protein [Crassaminicella indica]QXM07139.1 hypothetical protein KVH43_05395 [Crassaminicella indica]